MKDSSVILFIVNINSIVLTNEYKKQELRPMIANMSEIKRYMENIKLKDEREKRETKNHVLTNGHNQMYIGMRNFHKK